MHLSDIFSLGKQTFADWSEDRAPRLAAALAFYTAFALAPLLLIAIAVAGFFFGHEAATNQIGQQISGLLGPTAGEATNAMVQAASAQQGTGIVASIIGIATLLFAASGVFGELQASLDTIWEVQPKPGLGIWDTIKKRFFSFGMVVGVGFLLLVSLIISAILGALGGAVAGDQFGETLVWKIINFVVSFAVTTGLFALIFKVLPDVKVHWSDVWIGALVTALLFTIGKAILGWYLGRPGTTSTYGAAGSFVALLLWIYYSAQILFIGAEFTQVYAKTYGSRIQPDEDAVPITEEARAQQGMPRPQTVEETAHLKERQVGGGTTVGDANPAAAPAQPAGAVTLVGFIVGLLLGRRQNKTGR
ncbi:MAG TPA: YihY/virulence factor BrkB family protein [Roseiflexaceae bacterium]|nr:YihY/virulence factor BrkB family protein [Roseiflexaceae bacterium]